MIEIKPIAKIHKHIRVPASKSYLNRALIISSLADGISTLKDISLCDDTRYMINGLQSLGIDIEIHENTLSVHGTDGKLNVKDNKIFLGNAGTAVRFLTTMSALANNKVVITGTERMQQRPIRDLLEGISQIGGNIHSVNNNECPPLISEGGGLKGGTLLLNGSKSSQYLSSLLMCAPYAKKGLTIKINGNLTSRPYVDMTIDIMKKFGVTVDTKNYSEFSVKGGRHFSPIDYNIEGDASGASYFFAAAAVTGGTIRISNLSRNSIQGDIRFLEILKSMGCAVNAEDKFLEVTGGKLHGIEIDMNTMPDMVQTLAVVALFAEGETKITNIANLRIKETDRLTAISEQLRKVGADVKELKGGLVIKANKLVPAEIDTYNDHRMAMSFAVIGLKQNGIKIKNPGCVSKSFPNFFEIFNTMYRS